MVEQAQVFTCKWSFRGFLHPFIDNCGSGNEACTCAPISTISEIYKIIWRTNSFINLMKKNVYAYLFVCKHINLHIWPQHLVKSRVQYGMLMETVLFEFSINLAIAFNYLTYVIKR